MKKNSIYLDTSVLNFFFEGKDNEKVNSTKELFREIKQGKFSAFISELVLREIGNAPTLKKKLLLTLVKTYQPEILRVSQECLRLTERYMERGIFPAKYRDDALHIAIASIHEIDIVASDFLVEQTAGDEFLICCTDGLCNLS